MNAFNKLRIGTRLSIAFALVAILMLAMAVVTRIGLADIGGNMDRVLHDAYVKVKIVNDIGDEVNLQARIVRNLVIMDSDAQCGPEIATLLESRQRVSKAYEDLRGRLITTQGRELFQRVHEDRTAFVAEVDKLLIKVRGGDLAGAKEILLDNLRPRQLAYQKHLGELTAIPGAIDGH